MMLPLALVFALTLPIIRAQVPHWGPCPEPAVQPAFSLKQVPVTVQTVQNTLNTTTNIIRDFCLNIFTCQRLADCL